jgi:hypothetical protein
LNIEKSRFFETPETNNNKTHGSHPGRTEPIFFTSSPLPHPPKKSQSILKIYTVKSLITKYRKGQPSSRMRGVEVHLQGLSNTALVIPKFLSRDMRQTPRIAEQKNAL